MRMFALFGATHFGFFKIYGVCERTRRTRRKMVEPVQTFCGQGGEVNFFAILCGRL